MKNSEQQVFQAWVGLVRSSQKIMDTIEADLSEANLPPLCWYDVLLEINRETDKRLRLQDIGGRILLAKNNVTRLVDRLENDNLVVRKKCKSDGRGIYAYITDKGQDTLKSMWPVYRAAVNAHFSNLLTDTDIAMLNKIFMKIG